MTVIDDISAERARQRKSEGWTLGHDDEHTDGSLAAAAACYAYIASMRDDARKEHEDLDNSEGFISMLRFMWPESRLWSHWKPKDRRRDLVRAGALIVAEIERLDRRAGFRPGLRRPKSSQAATVNG